MAHKSGPKTLSTAANLANLLPTGTVLAFEALMPSFSNNGKCLTAHKCLIFSTVVICSWVCFLSSFTDSFVGNNGKLYYGIATVNGLCIFNKGEDDDSDDDDDDNKNDHKDVNDEEKGKNGCFGFHCFQTKNKKDDNIIQGVNMDKYRISPIDFVHAFASLLVFLVFATSSSDVQNCFFPQAGENAKVLMLNLPLGVGVLASFLFIVFPTKRRGIGYTDTGQQRTPKEGKGSTKPTQEQDNFTN